MKRHSRIGRPLSIIAIFVLLGVWVAYGGDGPSNDPRSVPEPVYAKLKAAFPTAKWWAVGKRKTENGTTQHLLETNIEGIELKLAIDSSGKILDVKVSQHNEGHATEQEGHDDDEKGHGHGKERGEHGADRVGCDAEDEAEFPDPDDLVDEARHPGEKEQQEDQQCPSPRRRRGARSRCARVAVCHHSPLGDPAPPTPLGQVGGSLERKHFPVLGTASCPRAGSGRPSPLGEVSR